MRRVGVILLLLFEALWLNAFLPGHTRGVVKLADGGCCQPKTCCDTSRKSESGTPQPNGGQCAVCFFAARLANAPAFVMQVPPPALLDEAPVPQPTEVVSI